MILDLILFVPDKSFAFFFLIRYYWISWDGVIRVGIGTDPTQNILLSYDNQLYMKNVTFRYASISTASNSVGLWTYPSGIMCNSELLSALDECWRLKSVPASVRKINFCKIIKLGCFTNSGVAKFNCSSMPFDKIARTLNYKTYRFLVK